MQWPCSSPRRLTARATFYLVPLGFELRFDKRQQNRRWPAQGQTRREHLRCLRSARRVLDSRQEGGLSEPQPWFQTTVLINFRLSRCLPPRPIAASGHACTPVCQQAPGQTLWRGMKDASHTIRLGGVGTDVWLRCRAFVRSMTTTRASCRNCSASCP